MSCQTDILMSMIFDDPECSQDAQPCAPGNMEIIEVTKIDPDGVGNEKPSMHSDHTYESMPVF